MKNVTIKRVLLALSFTGLLVTTNLIAGMKDDYKKAIEALRKSDEDKLSKVLSKYRDAKSVEELHKYDGDSGIILVRSLLIFPQPSEEKTAKMVKIILDNAAISGLKLQNHIIKYDTFFMPSAYESAENNKYKTIKKIFDDIIKKYKEEKKITK